MSYALAMLCKDFGEATRRADMIQGNGIKDEHINEKREFRCTFTWEKLQALLKLELASYGGFSEFCKHGAHLPAPVVTILIQPCSRPMDLSSAATGSANGKGWEVSFFVQQEIVPDVTVSGVEEPPHGSRGL